MKTRHKHKIEETAKVYLLLGEDGKWMLDPITDDGGALDGLDDGVCDTECDCDHTSEHNTALNQAEELGLPTLPELFQLMLDHLYPHDTPPDTTDRAVLEAWLDEKGRQ